MAPHEDIVPSAAAPAADAKQTIQQQQQPKTAAFPITPEYIAFLNDKLALLSPQEIVDWAIVSLPGLVQTTAFGLTGLVIRDLISKSEALKKTNAEVPLIFIDTLYQFPETLQLSQRVASHYNTTLHVYKPFGCETVADFEKEHGQRLWETDADIYDYLVKVEPGRRATLDFKAQVTITGRRRSQGAERASIPILEIDSSVSPAMLKLNVLAAWDYKQVWSYIIKNNVPYNPLHDQGYKSIGDWHSTAVTGEGENEREGRWKGQNKTECGLHKDFFKMRSSYIAAKKRKNQADGAAATADAENEVEEEVTEEPAAKVAKVVAA
ncbi:hypothetical protein HDU97_006452 [Phlyctochytrium planicorne]|nr:hypothetical protein HDU97_006452 [Phlyctochytrium planicorne]